MKCWLFTMVAIVGLGACVKGDPGEPDTNEVIAADVTDGAAGELDVVNTGDWSEQTEVVDVTDEIDVAGDSTSDGGSPTDTAADAADTSPDTATDLDGTPSDASPGPFVQCAAGGGCPYNLAFVTSATVEPAKLATFDGSWKLVFH